MKIAESAVSNVKWVIPGFLMDRVADPGGDYSDPTLREKKPGSELRKEKTVSDLREKNIGSESDSRKKTGSDPFQTQESGSTTLLMGHAARNDLELKCAKNIIEHRK